MTLSVLIATYNRCDDLKSTLECLGRQQLPGDIGYEIIVADNNSKDNTRGVVESFIPSFAGRLVYLFEPRQGQPIAHNTAIKAAKGDILVFTDDDCTFETDYLYGIYKLFQENPDVHFIGGKVVPRWVNCSRPEWIKELKQGWWAKDFFWGPLAAVDHGDAAFVLDSKDFENAKTKLFFGANMAVRKQAVLKCGAFNEEIPVAQDTELQMRYLRGGLKGLYAPHIKVHHLVTPERLTERYYYRWFYLRGLFLEIQTKYPKKFYHPLGISWSLIAQTVHLWISSVFSHSLTDKIHKRCHSVFNFGQMVQIAGKSKKTSP